MRYFSQLDPQWKDLTYFNGYTFGKLGCFVVSLSMLCDKDPVETAYILRNNGCFTSDGLLISNKAAQSLGLEYFGSSTIPPDHPCIAETNYYSPSVAQHFFIWFVGGDQWDPLNKQIKYPIKSYRLFKPKEQTMGFSENHMKTLIDHSVHKSSGLWFTSRKEADVLADIESVWTEVKNGSVDALANLLQTYANASNSQLMKKSDCEKRIKALEDDQIAEMAEHIVFAKQTKEEVKIRDDKIEELRQEKVDLEVELAVSKKTIEDLKKKECPDIDGFSASELFAKAIRKFIGLK